MDEELMNLSTEETFEVDTVEVIESQVEVEDLEQEIETEETLDIVEVETVEEIDIAVDEAIGWVGGDSTRHYSLYGRDEYDQHPITAITGLRAELDNIEKLQTVYSDKRSQANYYKWKDENILQENRVGYFVSIHEDINKIQICTGDNVFGVTVDTAGFIGGQSEIPRDITYGLVVCDGIAAVRCELDVSVDDYVIPNSYGIAQKVDNGYGYKVVALQDIGGIKHAVINLQIEINKIRNLVDNVDNLDERVGEAESNIVSAINMANAAYNKAGEAEYISEKALKDALESLKKSEETSDIIKDLENNISQNNTIAIEARAIAESAAVSAESIRQEAESKANQAISDTAELRKELEAKTSEINGKINDAELELEATKESIEIARNELSSEIDDIVSSLEDTDGKITSTISRVDENESSIDSLTAWKDTTNATITNISQKTDENSGNISVLTAWRSEIEEDIESIASIKAQSEANKSSIEGLTSWQDTTNRTLANVKQQSDANKASIENITSWQSAATESISAVKQTADQNSADISLITAWKSEVETDVSSIASIKTTADENKATIEQLVKKDTELSTTIAGVTTIANSNKANIEQITSWKSQVDPTISSVAGIKQTADNNAAKIEELTSWQGETKDTMTRIEQKADNNGASINSIVASIDKYSVGEYSQSYGLTHEQAVSILKEGMIYIPTEHLDAQSHSETFEDTGETNEFTPTNYYEWNGNDWIEYLHSVAFSSVEPTLTGTLKYWYIDSDTAPIGYEPYTLYMYENGKWIKVNIFYNNPSNRMVSSISQEVDEISAEIVNARGSVAALDMRLTNDEAEIQSLALWSKGEEEDGERYNLATIKQTADDAKASIALVVTETEGENVINAASIVAAINDGESSVVIDADHIDLSGIDVSLSGKTINISASDVLGIESTNFKVDTDGNIEAKNADIEGKITADDGNIGGWKIDETSLSKRTINTNKTITNNIAIQASSGSTDKAFSVSQINGDYTQKEPTTAWTDVFYVRNDGYLYAKKGEIGGCTIDDYGNLKIGNTNITDSSISTSKISGIDELVADKISSTTITAEVANIAGWTVNDYGIWSNGVLATRNSSNTRNINIATQCFYNSSCCNGGTGGYWLLTIGEHFGVEQDGELFCSKINATGGSIGGWNIDEDCLYSDIAQIPNAPTDLNYSTRVKMTPLTVGYRLANGTTFRTTNWANVVMAVNYWNATDSSLSDIAYKKDIESYSYEYDRFFDLLNPVKYKYIHGTSDRYHTGFIAQEVVESLNLAGLTTQDFAGVMLMHQGEEDEQWRLRRDEFVALNTWQIQKAKARITELEAQVASLTDRLEALEKGE